ncbi:MAG: Mov34/MPN/PAD-1 family protein [Saprospiraceae bacterium]
MTGIFAHAMEDFPNECCGFLYGNEQGGRIIERYVPVSNAREGDQRALRLLTPRIISVRNGVLRDGVLTLVGLPQPSTSPRHCFRT